MVERNLDFDYEDVFDCITAGYGYTMQGDPDGGYCVNVKTSSAFDMCQMT